MYSKMIIAQRTDELYQQILADMKPVWRLYKLYSYKFNGNYEAAHILTIRKDKKNSTVHRSLEERAEILRSCLNESLQEGEALTFENKCYNIHGKGYCISFCLEGYKKHVDRRGFIIGKSSPKTELIHRIGCAVAREQLHLTKTEKEYITNLMVNDTFKTAYSNPADRMVAVINWVKSIAHAREEIREQETVYRMEI